MKLELILFKACPYAQRVAIILGHVGLPFERTLINPAERPGWLKDLSPQGGVPLLRVDEDVVLFDSSAIGEFINDSAAAGLLPSAPLARARARGWIDFSGSCLDGFSAMITAADEKAFALAREGLMKHLHWLEDAWEGDGPLFAGHRFGLVDAAYAPLFMRMRALEAIVPFQEPEVLPLVSRWAAALLEMDAVNHAIDGDFSALFANIVRMRGRGGFVASRLG